MKYLSDDMNLDGYAIHSTNPHLNYATWSDKYGTVRFINYSYSTHFLAERAVWNPLPIRYFFATFWHYSIWIAAFYIAAVFALQQWMANRKPYALKTPLFLWNAFLAIFSAIGFWRVSEEFIYVIMEHSFKDSVCRTFDLHGPPALWGFLFAISKVFELVDTFFLILRKRPVIFLHWYHHAVVLIYCWHAARDVTAASRWFVGMNYGVHAIMYAYYAATSVGIRLPRLFSMSISVLQTAQMLVGVAISIFIAMLKYRHYYEKRNTLKNTSLVNSENNFVCQHTNENLALCFVIYASFALLFMNFIHVVYFSANNQRSAKRSVENRHITPVLETKSSLNENLKKKTL